MEKPLDEQVPDLIDDFDALWDCLTTLAGEVLKVKFRLERGHVTTADTEALTELVASAASRCESLRCMVLGREKPGGAQPLASQAGRS